MTLFPEKPILAFELEADLLIMATDTDGVYLDWGSESEKIISYRFQYN